MKRVRILRDTSGASIVIALVFFLICGIIGSVVMTAASVQAKAAQTHVDLQQKEYAMQSAAKLMAQQAHEGHPRRPRGGEGLRAGKLRI